MEQSLEAILKLSSKISTFMSIDVVGSTALKAGENDQDVIYTFLSYHKLVRQITYASQGEVMSISGDGIMCRFAQAQDGFHAARKILNEIPSFNKHQNRLSQPMALRIGVHTGEVLENESMAKGQLISHTIDLAAKLQQTSIPNHARFSQETVQLLKGDSLPTRLGWDAKLKVNVFDFTGDSAAPATKRALPSPFKILLVDDDIEDIMRLKKVLSSRHYESFAAYTLEQALLCTIAWQPHVVITSADLPWDSGWEYLKEARANATASTIPILLMSRMATGEMIEKGFSWGGNGFLTKPFGDSHVLKRLDVVTREFYL